jgi:hypothetical protein
VKIPALSGADRDDVMALNRSLLPHRCGEDGIGGLPMRRCAKNVLD